MAVPPAVIAIHIRHVFDPAMLRNVSMKTFIVEGKNEANEVYLSLWKLLCLQ